MSEEKDNLSPTAPVVKAPRLSYAKLVRDAGYAKLAHASANRHVTDAISCHFNLHSVMDAAS
jgi:hypothetical protein